MVALQGRLEDAGGAVAFEAPLERAEVLATGGIDCWVGGREPVRLRTRCLVNCAGLHAHAISGRIEGLDMDPVPPLRLAKGSYFGSTVKAPFRHLIYPAPVDGGLGVHVTLDLAGQMRFGPDVEWLDTADPDAVDYRVDAGRSQGFYAAVRRYWRGLPDDSIIPDYAGCRPKLSGPGAGAADFRIDGPAEHGIAGLVCLYGIESPGLTSSLAIAETVEARLRGLTDPY
jgi:L-2-hydroxyglutarate oxidase LhgO